MNIAGLLLEMFQFYVDQVRNNNYYNVWIILFHLHTAVCPDGMFECRHGRVDGQQPACISTEQRCDNVTDCIGGEDELEHNCPCVSEGAVRLVGSILPYQGRVEYCQNGRWATICRRAWDNSDASVVCRSLGYHSEGKTEKYYA